MAARVSRKIIPKTKTAAVILSGSVSASPIRCRLQRPLIVTAAVPMTSKNASSSSSIRRTVNGRTRTSDMTAPRPISTWMCSILWPPVAGLVRLLGLFGWNVGQGEGHGLAKARHVNEAAARPVDVRGFVHEIKEFFGFLALHGHRHDFLLHLFG